jgi:hypothetical protein
MKGLGMLYQGYRAVARSLLITIVFALVVALPASASAGEVTRGRFHTFAAGIDRDYDISGRAQMVRTANDETIVHVHVKGLAPHTAYGVHVHNKACDDANGGGHYRHDPAGDVNPVNEIWLYHQRSGHRQRLGQERLPGAPGSSVDCRSRHG